MPTSSSKEYTDARRDFMPLWASVFGLAKIVRSDEGDHPYDTLDMSGDGTENNPMARWEQYGDVAIPPTNTTAVYFKLGAGGISLSWSTIYQGRPTGLKRGTRALYSDGGATLHLHGAASTTPGRLDINAVAGTSPQDVVVNGGSLKVARDTDPTRSGTLTTQVTEVPGPPIVRTVVLTYTDEDGAVTPLLSMVFTAGLLTATTPAAGATVTAPVNGRIRGGADHFKG